MNYYLRSISAVCATFLFSPLHAANLGQITVADPVMGSRTLTYEQKNGFAVVEGDILIGKLTSLNNKGAVITPKVGGYRWPHGVVPYEINEELPDNNKQNVLKAINVWKKNSNIEFVELSAKNRNEYPDYISFTPAEGTTCASYVGRKKGRQEINLSPRCTDMNTVHEIGHALGLWHEQSRSDRDAYIRIIAENIQEDHKYNFDQQLNEGKDFGEYDYESIMHYGPYAFSKNGEKTIIPLVDGVEIGQRTHLSEKDLAAIKAMYPEV